MRALTIALCLLATPALADVAGIPNVIDGDTIEVHDDLRFVYLEIQFRDAGDLYPGEDIS